MSSGSTSLCTLLLILAAVAVWQKEVDAPARALQQ